MTLELKTELVRLVKCHCGLQAVISPKRLAFSCPRCGASYTLTAADVS